MRIRPSLLAGALVCSLVLLPIHAEEPAWGTDFGAALSKAEKSGRPVFADVWAIWCVPCREMDESTYRDEGVLEALGRFELLKVDADAQKIFVERYAVDAFPTILVLDEKGREISRMLGFVSAADLRGLLAAVESGWGDYRELRRGARQPEQLLRLGRFYARVGNSAEAAKCLRKAAKRLQGADREQAELELAGALIAEDRVSSGVKTLRRLASDASSPEIRGRALLALIDAEHARGRDEEAARLGERLRQEFPGLAPNS